MEKGQIVLCNLVLRTFKNKRVELNNIIFSTPYEGERTTLKMNIIEDRMIINKTKFKEDLQILNIDVIKELGFKHKTNKYTKQTKSDEERNTTTGAYD